MFTKANHYSAARLSSCSTSKLLTLLFILIALSSALVINAHVHAAPQIHVHYKVIDLGTLGGSNSQAFSVSPQNQVAGTSTTANDEFTRAFLWTNGKIRGLGHLPGGSTSGAAGVNLLGQVAGESDNAATDPNPFLCFTPNECRAFLWQDGRMKDLGALRHGHNSAGGWISDLGVVVGASETSTTNNPIVGFPPVHATAWVLGVPVDLGTLGGPLSIANSINDFGQITGLSQFNNALNPNTDFPSFHGFIFDRGHMTDLAASGGLGGTESEGISINNLAQITGDANLPGDQFSHAFIWQKGKMTDLGTLSGDPASFGGGINDIGHVVGWSGDGEENFRAALWANGTITDLNTLIPANGDLYLIVATSINPADYIAGFGVSQSTGEIHAFLLVPSFSNAAAMTADSVSADTAVAAPALQATPHFTLTPSLRRAMHLHPAVRRTP